jgi:hypothetical protein
MPVFRDEEHTYEVFGGLWREVLAESKLSEKLRRTKLTMKFTTKDLDGCMWIAHNTVLTGSEADQDAIITMELPADMAHEFWLDKLNVGSALTSNGVKVRGPLPKLMGLLPMLKFVYKKYPGHGKKHGLPTELQSTGETSPTMLSNRRKRKEVAW